MQRALRVAECAARAARAACPRPRCAPPRAQARVFAPAAPGVRRCIVATNIAETSVTGAGEGDGGWLRGELYGALCRGKQGPLEPILALAPAAAYAPSRTRSARVCPHRCACASPALTFLCTTPRPALPRPAVDGVVYVVDSGMVKQKSYNPATGMDSLGVTPISRCAAHAVRGTQHSTAQHSTAQHSLAPPPDVPPPPDSPPRPTPPHPTPPRPTPPHPTPPPRPAPPHPAPPCRPAAGCRRRRRAGRAVSHAPRQVLPPLHQEVFRCARCPNTVRCAGRGWGGTPQGGRALGGHLAGTPAQRAGLFVLFDGRRHVLARQQQQHQRAHLWPAPCHGPAFAPPQTPPEIQRTSLVAAVLYLKSLPLSIDVLGFDYLDAPAVRAAPAAAWEGGLPCLDWWWAARRPPAQASVRPCPHPPCLPACPRGPATAERGAAGCAAPAVCA